MKYFYISALSRCFGASPDALFRCFLRGRMWLFVAHGFEMSSHILPLAQFEQGRGPKRFALFPRHPPDGKSDCH